MDVENVSADGASACVISPIYTLMYHNGVNDLPVLHDDIYMDHKGIELFMGGSRWYNIDASTYSIKVCETGKDCDTHTC
jgi:tRNA A37 threonylcarbamoyladenosine biosynthesis protein TsaE